MYFVDILAINYKMGTNVLSTNVFRFMYSDLTEAQRAFD